ncbi:MAG: hypothetical protein P0S96_05855 [Simkaniaceae bacterium]|nr:hypothetical protein [Candidatus Sacchlamyda saccharinae]
MADEGIGGITFTIPNPMLFFQRPPAEEGEGKVEKKEEETTYRNEFSKLSFEFINDIEFFRDKYPLISLIMVVAFGIFSISSFFSISFVGFVSSALYGTISLSMAKAIGKKGGPFWSDVTGAVGQLLQSLALGSSKSTS